MIKSPYSLFPKVVLALFALTLTIVTGCAESSPDESPNVQSHKTAQNDRQKPHAKTDSTAQKKPETDKDSTSEYISGTLKDKEGKPMADVEVSDGYYCTLTDQSGHYSIKRRKSAKFVFYTVPSYCEIPVHSPSDRTAHFYKTITKSDSVYDFTLTRLPGGTEKEYTMIVIGDPQVTNAINPYYTGPNDNPKRKTDLERFTEETMEDIRTTISELPAGRNVYGLSMGDDVQYYGGYNASLELSIRHALGSSKMRLFSVIGNHDQDGHKLYRQKWGEAFGPEDYSFDRGMEHYVCFNDCFFYRGTAYRQPGELTKAQMKWLERDLSLTPKDKKIVLCYHIPLTMGTNPANGAETVGLESEYGHFTSSRLRTILTLLKDFSGGYELFCGHTHFAINHEIKFHGRNLYEHCHAAACGAIWQSNVNICGTPNGYYVYDFNSTKIVRQRYKGTRWDKSRQMSLFFASTDFNGESYSADWNIPKKSGAIVANVFNADSRWRVVAVEDGEEHLMSRISSIGQDAFATGYHHKYDKASPYKFISKANRYLIMNHLYYYLPVHPGHPVTVKATDPYGFTYTESSANAVTTPFFNYAHYYSSKPQKK